MRLPEFVQSTTVRWALAVAGAFGVCTLLLFGFVYWQTATYLTENLDAIIIADARLNNAEARDQELKFVMQHLIEDPRRVKLAELFGPDESADRGECRSNATGAAAR